MPYEEIPERTNSDSNSSSDINKLMGNIKYLKDLVNSVELPVIGRSIRLLDSFEEISENNPWFCMSLPDATLSIDHYPADFIAERRSRKIVYDELNTNISAFSGTWSSNVFTLANNAANNAMLAELAEDWLFAGSSTTNWRILQDGSVDGVIHEFNITGISVVNRTITVNLDGKSVSGAVISIYLNRVYGSTTSCRHFSWAGLGLYMTGQNKITGLRRRDKFQGFGFYGEMNGGTGSTTAWSNTACIMGASAYESPARMYSFLYNNGYGAPRVGVKTEVESTTILAYLYVGEYAA